MNQLEAKTHKHGLYILHWKGGGSSLAAVGSLHDGRRWFAPVNWTSKDPTGIASTDWRTVHYLIDVRTDNAQD